MSGGHFEYIQYRIEDAADQVQQYINRCESSKTDECGYKPEFADDIIAKFRECESTLRRGAAMLNCVDYLASNDIGEDTFRKRWEANVGKPKAGIEGLAIAIVRAAFIGDQNFISCLLRDDEGARLRNRILELSDFLRDASE